MRRDDPGRAEKGRPKGPPGRRLGFLPALGAAFGGSAVVSFILAWQGWLVVGMPPLAVLAYVIALAVWAPVRTAVGRLALGIVAFVGMVAGLYALPFLFEIRGGAAT